MIVLPIGTLVTINAAGRPTHGKRGRITQIRGKEPSLSDPLRYLVQMDERYMAGDGVERDAVWVTPNHVLRAVDG